MSKKDTVDSATYQRHLSRSNAHGNYFTFRRDYVTSGLLTKIQALFLQDLINLGYMKETQGKVGADGYFVCTADTLNKSLGWDNKSQHDLLVKLRDLGFIDFKRKGIPPKRHVYVDLMAIEKALDDQLGSQSGEKTPNQSRGPQSGEKTPGRRKEKPPTQSEEKTPEHMVKKKGSKEGIKREAKSGDATRPAASCCVSCISPGDSPSVAEPSTNTTKGEHQPVNRLNGLVKGMSEKNTSPTLFPPDQTGLKQAKQLRKALNKQGQQALGSDAKWADHFKVLRTKDKMNVQPVLDFYCGFTTVKEVRAAGLPTITSAKQFRNLFNWIQGVYLRDQGEDGTNPDSQVAWEEQEAAVRAYCKDHLLDYDEFMRMGDSSYTSRED